MIVAWVTDKDGKPTEMLGMFANDDELKAVALEQLAGGKDVHAGDVQEFSLGYSPAQVLVKRA